MNEKVPPCRVCGSNKDVICYTPDDYGSTICPDCCNKIVEHPDGESGHSFFHEKGEGWICKYCGILQECTDYDYND